MCVNCVDEATLPLPITAECSAPFFFPLSVIVHTNTGGTVIITNYSSHREEL